MEAKEEDQKLREKYKQDYLYRDHGADSALLEKLKDKYESAQKLLEETKSSEQQIVYNQIERELLKTHEMKVVLEVFYWKLFGCYNISYYLLNKFRGQEQASKLLLKSLIMFGFRCQFHTKRKPYPLDLRRRREFLDDIEERYKEYMIMIRHRQKKAANKKKYVKDL